MGKRRKHRRSAKNSFFSLMLRTIFFVLTLATIAASPTPNFSSYAMGCSPLARHGSGQERRGGKGGTSPGRDTPDLRAMDPGECAGGCGVARELLYCAGEAGRQDPRKQLSKSKI